MRRIGHLTFALLTAATLAAGPARANICQTDRLKCATNMPVDGYCECTSHGTTEDGTVVRNSQSRQPLNATSGGCGTQPNAPGCR